MFCEMYLFGEHEWFSAFSSLWFAVCAVYLQRQLSLLDAAYEIEFTFLNAGFAVLGFCSFWFHLFHSELGGFLDTAAMFLALYLVIFCAIMVLCGSLVSRLWQAFVCAGFSFVGALASSGAFQLGRSIVLLFSIPFGIFGILTIAAIVKHWRTYQREAQVALAGLGMILGAAAIWLFFEGECAQYSHASPPPDGFIYFPAHALWHIFLAQGYCLLSVFFYFVSDPAVFGIEMRWLVWPRLKHLTVEI